jgi:hypothetical protein
VDAWIRFWEIACIVGFGIFYVLVIAIIPAGGRDLFRLFRHLSEQADAENETPHDAGDPE